MKKLVTVLFLVLGMSAMLVGCGTEDKKTGATNNSGNLENSESVWLEGPNGKIFKENCCIRANRHIHCNKLDNIGYTNSILSTHILSHEMIKLAA